MQHPTAKIWGFPVPVLELSHTTPQQSQIRASDSSNVAPVPYLGIDTPTHTPRGATPLHAGTALLGRAVATPWSMPMAQLPRNSRHPAEPSPRFGHTAVALAEREKMLVFGGRCDENVFNDLWLLSLPDVGRENAANGEHSRQHSPTWGSPSYSRHSHSEAASPTKSFTATWEQVFPDPDAPAPLPRAGHTAVMCSGSTMLLFAGGDARTSFLADVWALDTDTVDWSLLSTPVSERLTYSPVSPCPPNAEGDVFPHGRKGHTAVYDPVSAEMIVFGGLLSTQRPKSDNRVWAFSTKTKKWRVRPSCGAAPNSCMYHVAELDVERRHMYIFGGRLLQPNSEHPFLGDLYQYGVDREVWRKVDIGTAFAPSPRMCSASALFNGKLLLLHGGSATYLSDFYELDLRTLEWRALPNVATPRTRPTLCRVNNTVVLFGGCFQNTYHNDLHVTELQAPTLSELCHDWIAEFANASGGSESDRSPRVSFVEIPSDVLAVISRRSILTAPGEVT